MRLGIFAKIFVRPTLAETLDAVAAHGLDCIQFNFACAGLPTLPEEIPPELAAKIGGEIRQRKLAVAAVSGTFNMIDPDPARRREGLRRLEVLAAKLRGAGRRRSSPFAPARATRRTCGATIRKTTRQRHGGICWNP